MRTIRLTVAYDGTAYAGWQVQAAAKTVQGVIEGAVEKVTGQPARVTASGRTDAGVHALGQVVAFQTGSRLSADVLRRALNAELPEDVAVLDAADVSEGFHPTRDAVRKRYRYVIHDGPVRNVFQRRYAWHYGRPLDTETMHRAAQSLRGTHDFSSFAASGSERLSNVRTIFDIFVARGQGDCPNLRSAKTPLSPCYEASSEHVITTEVEADGFLYNMVRAIVGTLVEIGRGAKHESWVAEILAAKDRKVAGPNAPPHGLFLVRVEYPRPCESPTSSRD